MQLPADWHWSGGIQKRRRATTLGQDVWELEPGTSTKKAVHPFARALRVVNKNEAPFIYKNSTPLSVLMLYFTGVIPPCWCDRVWNAPVLVCKCTDLTWCMREPGVTINNSTHSFTATPWNMTDTLIYCRSYISLIILTNLMSSIKWWQMMEAENIFWHIEWFVC
jgi:hypothetical protein